MIKTILRKITTNQNLYSKMRMFCTTNSCVQMQDWEYLSNINGALKKGQVNNAVNYLIKSHLQGKILDMQIYRNLHYYMLQQKMDLSYHELCYKIYRQYFKPHLLMENLMRTLYESKDSKIKNLLKQDYNFLNLPEPQMDTNNNAQTIKSKQDCQQNIYKERSAIFKDKDQLTDKYNLTLKAKNQQQLKNLFEKLLSNHACVTIKDVQIIYDEYMDDEDDKQTDILEVGDDQMYNNEDMYEKNLMISRIKIGRIEFSDKKNPQQDQ